MFIFIYLFPYFGGDRAALVPATVVPAMVVVGLGVHVVTVRFGRDLFVSTFMFIYVYVGVRFRFCPWWFQPLCSLSVCPAHLFLLLICPARLFPLPIRPAHPFPLPNNTQSATSVASPATDDSANPGLPRVWNCPLDLLRPLTSAR